MKILDFLKKTLDNPIVFNSFEALMGVNKTRRILVKDFIRPMENSKILDIGCGTGDFRTYLPDYIKYVGIDNNYKYIDYAKKKNLKIQNSSVQSQIKLIKLNI